MLRGVTGFFLTFEGPEGGGKSTQAERLATTLKDRGYTISWTREPGGTPVGEAIRQILLKRSRVPIGGWTEALLFTAARAQLVEDVIRPRIEAGEIVVSDRFSDSTLAYQGYGRGLELSSLERLQQEATRGLKPSLTFLLDLPVEQGLRRIAPRLLDRLDREPDAFHQRVRQAYLAMAAAEPERWLVLDARAEAGDLAEQIVKATIERLERAGVGMERQSA